jgi:glyoxylase-like metal-dependent hydrolase (beta-lactamase superfamily II)
MGIPFITEPDVSYAIGEKLSPKVRRVICENPGPFTYTGTSSFIVGTGAVAVIDPGPAHPAHLEAILAALDPGEVITHILATHTHSDHSPLAHDLKARTGANICGFDLPGHNDGTTQLINPEFVQMEEAIDRDFRPDIPLAHGDELTGPDWTLEAVHTPGHISNHLCFALHEEKTLFTGDHIMGWATSVVVPPEGNMADYMASLELLLARDDTLYRPTHGPAIPDPQNFVRAYIAHRHMRETQILEQLAAGVHKIADMIPVLYAETDPRLHPAAAMSVYAHLEGLVETGRAVCDGPISLSADFAATH